MRNNSGFSLIEVIIVAVMGAVLLLGLFRMIGPISDFFRSTQVRISTAREAQRAMEAMKQVLVKANPKTVAVLNNIANAPPNSRIQFADPRNRRYEILWLPDRQGTIELGTPDNNGNATQRSVLATRASLLTFTFDARDPALVYISLRLNAPTSARIKPGEEYTVFLPNQMVHMVDNP